MVSISNDFACSFFQKMNEQEKGQSFFISPLSAQFNLGMVANGASGETLQEIESVLSASGSKLQSINSYFLKLMNNLPQLDSSTIFQSANSIWIHDESPIKATFQQINQKYFLAETQNLDFSDPKSTDIINQWTKEQRIDENTITHSLIQDFRDTSLSLFFKGGWIFPFDPAETRQENFYPVSGKKHPVSIQLILSDADSHAFQLASLNVAMQESMDTPFLGRITVMAYESDSISCMLDLKLPSIKLDYKSNIIPTFQKMGIHDAFNANCADFSRMTDMPAYISDSKTTFVIVAAAATVPVSVTSNRVNCSISEIVSEITPYPFHVNRPFLLVIHENKTGLILFMGKMMDIL